MMRRLLLAASSAASALALLAAPSSAHAAPAPSCNPATMTPTAATIPVNLPAFAYTALTATAADVHLFTANGAKTELPLTVGPVVDGFLQVKPAAPLTVGSTYELDFSPFCGYGGYPVQGPITFTVTAEAPLPTKLGGENAPPTVVLHDYGTTEYTITGHYTFAAEMKPWVAAYAIDLVLDGALVATKLTVDATGSSAQAVGTGWCDAANAATRTHTIQLRGTLPFAPTVESPAVSVDFDCPAPNIATPPPGTVSPPPGSGSSSSGNTGGGGKAGGCAASPAGAGGGGGVALFGLGLGLALRARRRLSAKAAATRRT